MKKLLLATTIAAAGMLPLSAMAGSGQSQTGASNAAASDTKMDGRKSTMDSNGTAATGAKAAEAYDWDRGKRFTDKDDLSGLAGRTVSSSKGDEIGRIDSVVTDAQGNSYAVMDVGTFLAIGEKRVAVPMDRLRRGDGDVVLMSPESEGNLENQDTFESTGDKYQPYEYGRKQQ